MSWKYAGYVIASKNRKAILSKLEDPATPTILAKMVNLHLANVSRTLTELESKGLIACLTPTQRVGRIYSLTKKGREVLVMIKKMEHVNG